MSANASPFSLLASISSLKAELERIKVEKGQVSLPRFAGSCSSNPAVPGQANEDRPRGEEGTGRRGHVQERSL